MPFEFGISLQHYTFAEAAIRTYHNEETILLRCQSSSIRRLIYGESGGEVPVFYGARTETGHGLGSILGGLFRRALPFLSSGAKILGQQAMNVASDMIDGKSFQDSAKSRLKGGIKTSVTSNPIIPQSGSGVRRKRRR